MSNQRYFMGLEGFIWWTGVVEARNDPEKMGRVRVRCFGWHTEDKSLIPTDSLPWAQTLLSPNLPATYTPKEGDWVVGFFVDGSAAQHPVIMGVLTGKPTKKPDVSLGFSDPSGTYPKNKNEPTTNRLARGRKDGTIIEKRERKLKKGVTVALSDKTWSEPAPAFAPVYPFNYAHETESGHAFELDDTAGNERVHIAHTNGSFIEMNAKGNRVEKIIKDNYTIVLGDNFVSIDGVCNITVNGNCNLKTKGKLNIDAAEINMKASGDIKMKAGGSLKTQSGGTTHVKSGGSLNLGSVDKASLKGSSVGIQGNSVSLAGKVANKVKTPHGIGTIIPTGSATSPSDAGL